MAEELDAPFDWWRTNKNGLSGPFRVLFLARSFLHITNLVSRKPVYLLTWSTVCLL